MRPIVLEDAVGFKDQCGVCDVHIIAQLCLLPIHVGNDFNKGKAVSKRIC